MGLLFFNEFYSNAAGYVDLPSVNDDEKTVNSLFQLMQIMEEYIFLYKDATYDKMHRAF